MSFVNYINTNTQSNGFISALNTNTRIAILFENDRYIAMRFPTMHIKLPPNPLRAEWCASDNVPVAAVFHSTAYYPNHTDKASALYFDFDFEPIAGFFAACTPLQGFLSSTLNCLHDTECLQLLLKYFPSLNRV